jgi:hypothetical protein
LKLGLGARGLKEPWIQGELKAALGGGIEADIGRRWTWMDARPQGCADSALLYKWPQVARVEGWMISRCGTRCAKIKIPQMPEGVTTA